MSPIAAPTINALYLRPATGVTPKPVIDRRSGLWDVNRHRPRSSAPRKARAEYRAGGVIHVTLAPQLVAAGVVAWHGHVDALIGTTDADMVLDLCEVRHLDGSGIGALAALKQRAAQRGLNLLLANIDGQPLRLLRTLGIADILLIEEYD